LYGFGAPQKIEILLAGLARVRHRVPDKQRTRAKPFVLRIETI
jgi:hypothetical protein